MEVSAESAQIRDAKSYGGMNRHQQQSVDQSDECGSEKRSSKERVDGRGILHKGQSNKLTLDTSCEQEVCEAVNNLHRIEKKSESEIISKHWQKSVHSRLYTKYSSSQNFYYTRDVKDILANARTLPVIEYKDMAVLDEDGEFLKRMYGLVEYPKKIQLLSEYYKYHSDIPRLFLLPETYMLNSYHDKKRRLDYYKIAQMIEEENQQNPDRPPKGIVGEKPQRRTEEDDSGIFGEEVDEKDGVNKNSSKMLGDISSFINRGELEKEEKEDKLVDQILKNSGNIKLIRKEAISGAGRGVAIKQRQSSSSSTAQRKEGCAGVEEMSQTMFELNQKLGEIGLGDKSDIHVTQHNQQSQQQFDTAQLDQFLRFLRGDVRVDDDSGRGGGVVHNHVDRDHGCQEQSQMKIITPRDHNQQLHRQQMQQIKKQEKNPVLPLNNQHEKMGSFFSKNTNNAATTATLQNNKQQTSLQQQQQMYQQQKTIVSPTIQAKLATQQYQQQVQQYSINGFESNAMMIKSLKQSHLGDDSRTSKSDKHNQLTAVASSPNALLKRNLPNSSINNAIQSYLNLTTNSKKIGDTTKSQSQLFTPRSPPAAIVSANAAQTRSICTTDQPSNQMSPRQIHPDNLAMKAQILELLVGQNYQNNSNNHQLKSIQSNDAHSPAAGFLRKKTSMPSALSVVGGASSPIMQKTHQQQQQLSTKSSATSSNMGPYLSNQNLKLRLDKLNINGSLSHQQQQQQQQQQSHHFSKDSSKSSVAFSHSNNLNNKDQLSQRSCSGRNLDLATPKYNFYDMFKQQINAAGASTPQSPYGQLNAYSAVLQQQQQQLSAGHSYSSSFQMDSPSQIIMQTTSKVAPNNNANNGNYYFELADNSNTKQMKDSMTGSSGYQNHLQSRKSLSGVPIATTSKQTQQNKLHEKAKQSGISFDGQDDLSQLRKSQSGLQNLDIVYDNIAQRSNQKQASPDWWSFQQNQVHQQPQYQGQQQTKQAATHTKALKHSATAREYPSQIADGQVSTNALKNYQVNTKQSSVAISIPKNQIAPVKEAPLVKQPSHKHTKSENISSAKWLEMGQTASTASSGIALKDQQLANNNGLFQSINNGSAIVSPRTQLQQMLPQQIELSLSHGVKQEFTGPFQSARDSRQNAGQGNGGVSSGCGGSGGGGCGGELFKSTNHSSSGQNSCSSQNNNNNNNNTPREKVTGNCGGVKNSPNHHPHYSYQQPPHKAMSQQQMQLLSSKMVPATSHQKKVVRLVSSSESSSSNEMFQQQINNNNAQQSVQQQIVAAHGLSKLIMGESSLSGMITSLKKMKKKSMY